MGREHTAPLHISLPWIPGSPDMSAVFTLAFLAWLTGKESTTSTILRPPLIRPDLGASGFQSGRSSG